VIGQSVSTAIPFPPTTFICIQNYSNALNFDLCLHIRYIKIGASVLDGNNFIFYASKILKFILLISVPMLKYAVEKKIF
jgi:hypothetical protein